MTILSEQSKGGSLNRVIAGDEVFEGGCDHIEVTSLHRPDTSWLFIDSQGHEHRWYVNGEPATLYSPTAGYETPTLIWVKDGEEYWEDDDEPHDVGHLECRQCAEHIKPGYKPDDCVQYIPGVRWFRINGQPVQPEEFKRRYEEAVQRKVRDELTP